MIKRKNQGTNINVSERDKESVVDYLDNNRISHEVISEDDPILEFDGDDYYSLSDILMSHVSDHPEYLVSGKNSLTSSENRASFSFLDEIVEFVVDNPFDFEFLSEEYLINDEMESFIDGFNEIKKKARRINILNKLSLDELDKDVHEKYLKRILKEKDQKGNTLLHKSINEKKYSFFGRLLKLGENLDRKRGILILDSSSTGRGMIEKLDPKEQSKFLSYLL